jgi:ribonuclease P protein component
MIDEAHFPAKPPRAQAPSRFPLALGHARRPQGPRRPSRTRTQDAFRLTRSKIETISRRADFLAANAGRRAPMPGFVLLVRPRGDDSPAMRLGITVTKKIGNAVVRNRMKRRFRSLAREILPEAGLAGADHILIGRAGGVERDFEDLRRELGKALARATA